MGGKTKKPREEDIHWTNDIIPEAPHNHTAWSNHINTSAPPPGSRAPPSPLSEVLAGLPRRGRPQLPARAGRSSVPGGAEAAASSCGTQLEPSRLRERREPSPPGGPAPQLRSSQLPSVPQNGPERTAPRAGRSPAASPEGAGSGLAAPPPSPGAPAVPETFPPSLKYPWLPRSPSLRARLLVVTRRAPGPPSPTLPAGPPRPRPAGDAPGRPGCGGRGEAGGGPEPGGRGREGEA
ncbi:translation initiation factor IF-2-like [Psammomys obesus]|uniref:translation initiation factor IF-2-like n=1 Tax=Psammomys obesus TaxID=48139 RepID=UPI0024529D12|nr:translation initiation factor IF-2-like [Psammomys obesus]